MSLQPGAYRVDNYTGINVRPESSFSGYTAGPSGNGYPPVWEDPYVLERRDVLCETGPGIPNIVNDRPEVRESNVLFVDGIPSDCSRREVSRILFSTSAKFDPFTYERVK